MRALDKRDLDPGSRAGEQPPGGGTLSPGVREVSVGCTPGGVGAGAGPGHRVGCGHAHPTGLPARPASCAPRESRSRFGKVSRCIGTLGIWTGSRKLHLSLFFREPVGVFLLVLFCEALIGLEGKAAELWGEDENENIDLFVEISVN